ncbi:MAG: hypothetical protein ACOYNN_12225, partial [Terrimicrobiaceae bacterium]
MKTIWIFVILLALSGCATKSEREFNQVMSRINKTHFQNRPALYSDLRREGKISDVEYQTLMAQWKEADKDTKRQIAAERQRADRDARIARAEWESLTPYQRKQIQAQQQSLAIQQQQIAIQQQQMEWEQQQARQNAVIDAMDNVASDLQRSAERTRSYRPPYQMLPVGNGGGIPMIDRPQYRVNGEIGGAPFSEQSRMRVFGGFG